MNKYIELNNNNFEKVTSDGVLLVDFWASWCGPCRMLAPVIDELAIDFENKAKICKVNVDEENEIAIKYGIKSLPTLLIIKDGEIVDVIIGANSKMFLTDKINSYL